MEYSKVESWVGKRKTAAKILTGKKFYLLSSKTVARLFRFTLTLIVLGWTDFKYKRSKTISTSSSTQDSISLGIISNSSGVIRDALPAVPNTITPYTSGHLEPEHAGSAGKFGPLVTEPGCAEDMGENFFEDPQSSTNQSGNPSNVIWKNHDQQFSLKVFKSNLSPIPKPRRQCPSYQASLRSSSSFNDPNFRVHD